MPKIYKYRLHRAGARAALSIGWTAVLLTGCAALFSSATERMARDLSIAMLNQTDPETVEHGAPAYLLMIDGLIEGDPGNTGLLLSAARLYGSYASVFVKDQARARRLTDRSRSLALRALCSGKRLGCDGTPPPFEAFEAMTAAATAADVPLLYTYGGAWAAWIERRRDDWNALASLPVVRVSMERVVALQEAHDHGGAHLYLGYLATLLPPTLGGRPSEGRDHFERAIALSGGKSLAPKVMLAERYARLNNDRKLHDALLKEVISADPRSPGLTLMNTLAQRQARELLVSADEHFFSESKSEAHGREAKTTGMGGARPDPARRGAGAGRADRP